MNKILARILFVATLAASSSLLAHPGHGLEAFHDGFLHPIFGADHLLVALAVRMWAASAYGSWMRVVAFLLGMSAGFLAGTFGLNLPLVEQGIFLSLLVLGLFLMTDLSLRAFASTLTLFAFGIFHGNAHGVELAQVFNISAFVGLILATAMLHIAGIAVIRLLQSKLVLERAVFAQRCVGALFMGAAAWL
jgi:urease accessory protein